jgi:hypothetical protein
LIADPHRTLSARQLLAKRVEGVQKDSVLVVHGLNARDGARMRG